MPGTASSGGQRSRRPSYRIPSDNKVICNYVGLGVLQGSSRLVTLHPAAARRVFSSELSRVTSPRFTRLRHDTILICRGLQASHRSQMILLSRRYGCRKHQGSRKGSALQWEVLDL